ncbi:MAG: hypothetical protein HEQ23_07045 [Tepidisphaera sp.]
MKTNIVLVLASLWSVALLFVPACSSAPTSPSVSIGALEYRRGAEVVAEKFFSIPWAESFRSDIGRIPRVQVGSIKPDLNCRVDIKKLVDPITVAISNSDKAEFVTARQNSDEINRTVDDNERVAASEKQSAASRAAVDFLILGEMGYTLNAGNPGTAMYTLRLELVNVVTGISKFQIYDIVYVDGKFSAVESK